MRASQEADEDLPVQERGLGIMRMKTFSACEEKRIRESIRGPLTTATTGLQVQLPMPAPCCVG